MRRWKPRMIFLLCLTALFGILTVSAAADEYDLNDLNELYEFSELPKLTDLPEMSYINAPDHTSSSGNPLSDMSESSVSGNPLSSAAPDSVNSTPDGAGSTANAALPGNNAVISVESVQILPQSLTLPLGEAEKLTVNIFPADASDQTVTWSVSDNTVATVDADGTVIAWKPGRTIVTVSAADGHKTAQCEVTVTVPVTDITFHPAGDIALSVGESIKIDAVVLPENATDKTVIWSSRGESIAAVDQNGVVTGLDAGITIITAVTREGNKFASAMVNVTDLSVARLTDRSQYTTLENAFAAARDGDTVTLTENVTLRNALTVTDGKNLVLNLNGNILNASALNTLFSADSTGTLNIIGAGTVRASNLSDPASGIRLTVSGGAYTTQSVTRYLADGYTAVETNGSWTVQPRITSTASVATYTITLTDGYGNTYTNEIAANTPLRLTAPAEIDGRVFTGWYHVSSNSLFTDSLSYSFHAVENLTLTARYRAPDTATVRNATPTPTPIPVDVTLTVQENGTDRLKFLTTRSINAGTVERYGAYYAEGNYRNYRDLMRAEDVKTKASDTQRTSGSSSFNLVFQTSASTHRIYTVIGFVTVSGVTYYTEPYHMSYNEFVSEYGSSPAVFLMDGHT